MYRQNRDSDFFGCLENVEKLKRLTRKYLKNREIFIRRTCLQRSQIIIPFIETGELSRKLQIDVLPISKRCVAGILNNLVHTLPVKIFQKSEATKPSLLYYWIPASDSTRRLRKYCRSTKAIIDRLRADVTAL